MEQLKNIKEYLEKAIDSFIEDPADTDFEEGYIAALRNVYDFLCMLEMDND